jgi:long-chain acyl-CoA synthetase
VRDSAVIGTDRVHAVLILEPGANQEKILREANSQLADYQRIRTASVWPYPEFPRTEGTGKLKRHEIAKGTPPVQHVSRFDPNVPLESLTSLERVERMVALGMDESEFSSASQAVGKEQPIEFPRWNRSPFARTVRRVALSGFLLPLLRVFAHIRVEGAENLADLQPPVLFAPTHQSYLDVPAILAALPSRWRHRVAPAMSKEFFKGHFHGRSFTNSLNYYLACLLFNAFPIPQREAGALETMRYMGELTAEGYCVLIFPEGRMTDGGEIAPFQPGVGMLGAKLDIPVVPVRLMGLDKVLHRTWKMARPGRVIIRFGPALRLNGEDYQALAKQVEAAARKA